MKPFYGQKNSRKTVVQLLVNQDESIFHQVSRQLEQSNEVALTIAEMDGEHTERRGFEEEKLIALIQTIFELHLDNLQPHYQPQ